MLTHPVHQSNSIRTRHKRSIRSFDSFARVSPAEGAIMNAPLIWKNIGLNDLFTPFAKLHTEESIMVIMIRVADAVVRLHFAGWDYGLPGIEMQFSGSQWSNLRSVVGTWVLANILICIFHSICWIMWKLQNSMIFYVFSTTFIGKNDRVKIVPFKVEYKSKTHPVYATKKVFEKWQYIKVNEYYYKRCKFSSGYFSIDLKLI